MPQGTHPRNYSLTSATSLHRSDTLLHNDHRNLQAKCRRRHSPLGPRPDSNYRGDTLCTVHHLDNHPCGASGGKTWHMRRCHGRETRLMATWSPTPESDASTQSHRCAQARPASAALVLQQGLLATSAPWLPRACCGRTTGRGGSACMPHRLCNRAAWKQTCRAPRSHEGDW